MKRRNVLFSHILFCGFMVSTVIDTRDGHALRPSDVDAIPEGVIPIRPGQSLKQAAPPQVSSETRPAFVPVVPKEKAGEMESIPPARASVKALKKLPCKAKVGCKALVRLELENPGTMARWVILPAEQSAALASLGSISLVRTYRFVDDEDEIVMGEFEGSKPFRAIFLPPMVKLVVQDFPLMLPEQKSTSFQIFVTSGITVNSMPLEAETTIDFWISGGASSKTSKPEVLIRLAPMKGHDFEGLAGSIRTQDGKERTVTFSEPLDELNLSLDDFR